MSTTRIKSSQATALSNLQFQKVIMVNGRAYSTFAAAYMAAAGVATGSNPVAMLVGSGLAADFGSLTLSDTWNPDVSIMGISPDVSRLGGIVTGGNTTVVGMRNVALNGITGTATVKAVCCKFTADLSSISGDSIFQQCNIAGSILNLSSNGAQLVYSNILSSGTSIDASVTRSIFLQQCLLSSEVGANVTVDGTYSVFPNLRLP